MVVVRQQHIEENQQLLKRLYRHQKNIYCHKPGKSSQAHESKACGGVTVKAGFSFRPNFVNAG